MTMIVLSAIGDIQRFESAKQLVGYAGLGAGVHDSGKEHIDLVTIYQTRRVQHQALC